jgi:hypothetical protein
MNKLLALTTLLSICSLPICAAAQDTGDWKFDEKGRSALELAISDLADRLYSQAESEGGGENGINYQTIIQEHVAKFEALLQKPGAPINNLKSGMSPLMRAACHHQWEIIELLIKAGADVGLTDEKGLTALHYVALRTWVPVLSYSWFVSMIMSKYYTKERHNKCVELLANSRWSRMWYQRRYLVYGTMQDAYAHLWQIKRRYIDKAF